MDYVFWLWDHFPHGVLDAIIGEASYESIKHHAPSVAFGFIFGWICPRCLRSLKNARSAKSNRTGDNKAASEAATVNPGVVKH